MMVRTLSGLGQDTSNSNSNSNSSSNSNVALICSQCAPGDDYCIENCTDVGTTSGATTTATVTNPATASQCCAQVGGTLNGSLCTMPALPALPGYCAIPFISSLFSDCKTGGAISQTAADAYTNFKICQQSGVEAGAAAVAASEATEAALPQSTCSYNAAAAWPNLSNILGANLTAMLTNPFNTGCQADVPPGIILYAGLGLAALLLFMALGKAER